MKKNNNSKKIKGQGERERERVVRGSGKNSAKVGKQKQMRK